MCRGGRFWMRWTFESVGWVRQTALPGVGGPQLIYQRPEWERILSLSDCLWAGTSGFSCFWTPALDWISSHGSQPFGLRLELYHRLSCACSLQTTALALLSLHNCVAQFLTVCMLCIHPPMISFSLSFFLWVLFLCFSREPRLTHPISKFWVTELFAQCQNGNSGKTYFVPLLCKRLNKFSTVNYKLSCSALWFLNRMSYLFLYLWRHIFVSYGLASCLVNSWSPICLWQPCWWQQVFGEVYVPDVTAAETRTCNSDVFSVPHIIPDI